MNITVNINGNTKRYCGAQYLSIVEGQKIFFMGKYKNNAVEIPLGELFKYLDVELSIREKRSCLDYADDLKKYAEITRYW